MGLDNVRLQSDLQPGEVLEWSGKPSPRRLFTVSDFYVIPFSLLWGGSAIFWEISVVASGAPLFFELCGVPFVLIGLYLIFGRFLYTAWERRHTWYGVTSQRIIILTTTFGHRVESFYFGNMLEIETRISGNGYGTFLFGEEPTYRGYVLGFDWGRRRLAPGFYSIPDARYVFELISRHRTRA